VNGPAPVGVPDPAGAGPWGAGRNLPAAIGIGLLLGGLVVGTLFLAPLLFIAVVVGAMCWGTVEIYRAAATAGLRRGGTNTATVGVVVIIVAAAVAGATGLVLAFALAFLAGAVLRLRRGPEGYLTDTGLLSFTLAYLGVLPGFVMLLLRHPDGQMWVFVFIVLTVANDVGGYAVGAAFGRHKVAPRLSPSKSWEGLAGSLTAQVVLGAWLFPVLLNRSAWLGVAVALILTVVATSGDVLESAIKRDAGVKDSGTTLPGHGGILDRLDSLLPNAAAAYLIVVVLDVVEAGGVDVLTAVVGGPSPLR